MEGSPDFMADYIEDILPLVFRSLRDPEATVIRTTLVTLGQITDELPTEVTKHHVTMVPVVFELLGSNNLEIVKAACSSLDAILEWVPKEAVEQYLPKLMEALLYILTTDVDTDVKNIVAGISHYIIVLNLQRPLEQQHMLQRKDSLSTSTRQCILSST